MLATLQAARSFGDEMCKTGKGREGKGIMAMLLTETIDRAVPKGSYLDPIVVRPAEACRMLSVARTQLYRLLHAGELESFRYGRYRRITIASIQAYVQRQVAANSRVSWD